MLERVVLGDGTSRCERVPSRLVPDVPPRWEQCAFACDVGQNWWRPRQLGRLAGASGFPAFAWDGSCGAAVLGGVSFSFGLDASWADSGLCSFTALALAYSGVHIDF